MISAKKEPEPEDNIEYARTAVPQMTTQQFSRSDIFVPQKTQQTALNVVSYKSFVDTNDHKQEP